jgi:hypothetical protein
MRPMELPPGRTRVEAREDTRRTLEGERVEARSKRSPDPFMEVEHQLKQARVVGMKAQAAQIAIQSIQTITQMLRENADVYIEMNGQQGYNKMLAGLLTRMARMGEEDIREMNTPVSVGCSLLSEQLVEQGIEDDED